MNLSGFCMFMLLAAGSLNLVVDAQTNSSLLPITILPGDGETCPSSETARSEIEEEVRTILQQIFNLTDSGTPRRQKRVLAITPDNVESLATYIHPGATIIDSRVIQFADRTSADELLLEVPLGTIEPNSTVRVTVGIGAPPAGSDHDPAFGLSDGIGLNDFIIVDTDNFVDSAACYPISGTHEDTRVADSNFNPAQTKMLFRPSAQYGACYLPLDAGYINVATFSHQLDLGNIISLTMQGNHIDEEYAIDYFVVEIF